LISIASLAPHDYVLGAHLPCRFTEKSPAFRSRLEEGEIQIRAEGGQDQAGRAVSGANVYDGVQKQGLGPQHREDKRLKGARRGLGAGEIDLL
jgi:hypothetical protein